MQNYSTVPQRIQGWFICISAHWHLAVLMLADLLKVVDENSLGTEYGTHSRGTSQISMEIRTYSAKELSNIAKVATPDASLNMTDVRFPPRGKRGNPCDGTMDNHFDKVFHKSNHGISRLYHCSFSSDLGFSLA